jgi:hypothetical protein
MIGALSGLDRLNLLIPWLNGAFDEDRFAGRGTDYAAIRHAIAEFARSFDGSAAALHFEVVEDPAPEHIRRLSGRQQAEPSNEEIDVLGEVLRILLTKGFGDGLMGDLKDSFLPLTGLGIAVRHAGRREPYRRRTTRIIVGGSEIKRVHPVVGGAVAQRAYRAAGAYVKQVYGPKTVLVPFLLAELLTAPDMVAVKRCQTQGCRHFVVADTATRGPRRKFCLTCRPLNAKQRERQLKRQRKQRRRK